MICHFVHPPNPHLVLGVVRRAVAEHDHGFIRGVLAQVSGAIDENLAELGGVEEAFFSDCNRNGEAKRVWGLAVGRGFGRIMPNAESVLGGVPERFRRHEKANDRDTADAQRFERVDGGLKRDRVRHAEGDGSRDSAPKRTHGFPDSLIPGVIAPVGHDEQPGLLVGPGLIVPGLVVLGSGARTDY
jgi:hypothetical protein